ncbi:hypothetical protein Tco_0767133 [Tanacetum coccineum]
MTRVDSLEKDLKQTKLTMRSAIMKLVKKVKKLEGILTRRNVVLSDSEEEEPEDQGRKSQDDPLVSLVQGLCRNPMYTFTSYSETRIEPRTRKEIKACSFMLCDLDFEPLSLSLSSMPSCDLMSLTNMLILLHYLESFKSELAEVFVFKS